MVVLGLVVLRVGGAEGYLDNVQRVGGAEGWWCWGLVVQRVGGVRVGGVRVDGVRVSGAEGWWC